MNAIITFHVIDNGYIGARLRRSGMEYGPMGSSQSLAKGNGPTVADALRDLIVQMSKNDVNADGL